MSNMILGNYTFDRNPSECGLFTPVRHAAAVLTYTSAAFFSWGSGIAGKTVNLRWGFMPIDQYNQLLTIMEADVSLNFTPFDGSGRVFSVEVTNLDGSFHVMTSIGYRKDVVLSLFILGEAA